MLFNKIICLANYQIRKIAYCTHVLKLRKFNLFHSKCVMLLKYWFCLIKMYIVCLNKLQVKSALLFTPFTPPEWQSKALLIWNLFDYVIYLFTFLKWLYCKIENCYFHNFVVSFNWITADRLRSRKYNRNMYIILHYNLILFLNYGHSEYNVESEKALNDDPRIKKQDAFINFYSTCDLFKIKRLS